MERPVPTHRYVFVAGLHRSGTSLIARAISSHPDIASISGAAVPEDEGVYLQGAIPHTARSGIPGEFAFDPAQHLTEHSPYNSLEVSERLQRDWSTWFDPKDPWRLEKSPVNLLRTRLYQQLFPRAHFIIVVRHPVVVAQATRKWTDASVRRLIHHWQAAYRIALSDLDHLHCALIVRYEDFCADPDRELAATAAFLTLDPAGFSFERASVRNRNAEYAVDTASHDLPRIARTLGYGTTEPLSPGIGCRHVLRAVRDEVTRIRSP